MAETGQQCDHELARAGRHRVCRECAQIYMAVAGPSEVVLLGQYAGIHALLSEYDALTTAPAPEVRAAAGQEARELEAARRLIRDMLPFVEGFEDAGPIGEGWQSDRLLSLIARARAAATAVERDRAPGTISKRCGVQGCTLTGLH